MGFRNQTVNGKRVMGFEGSSSSCLMSPTAKSLLEKRVQKPTENIKQAVMVGA